MNLSKKLLKQKLSQFIILCIGIFLFLFLIFIQQNKNVTIFSNQEKIISTQKQFGLPVHIKIPNINVDASVEYVGLTEDGTMDAPKGPSEVAWYNLGPRPGGNGSAVINGHSGWKGNIKAVFDDLYKLKKGDKIYIENDIGVIITFVVRESRSYDSNADASDIFVSNDGKSHLNLVTCSGLWNDTEKSHPNRIVVFADRE